MRNTNHNLLSLTSLSAPIKRAGEESAAATLLSLPWLAASRLRRALSGRRRGAKQPRLKWTRGQLRKASAAQAEARPPEATLANFAARAQASANRAPINNCKRRPLERRRAGALTSSLLLLFGAGCATNKALAATCARRLAPRARRKLEASLSILQVAVCSCRARKQARELSRSGLNSNNCPLWPQLISRARLRSNSKGL